MPGSWEFIGTYWLCPTSSAIRYTMLRPRLFSLTGECPSCSAPQGIGSRSPFIAYWLTSAWHVSHICVTVVSSPLSSVWLNVARNNWHQYKPWRLIDWPRLLHHQLSSPVVCELSMNPPAMSISKNWNGILSILSILKFKFAFSQLCGVLRLEMYSVKLFSYLCRIFKLGIVFPKGYSLICYIVL